MKLLFPLVYCLVILGPIGYHKTAMAEYASVAFWTEPNCQGDANFTQAYKTHTCIETKYENVSVSYLFERLNDTHAIQLVYNNTECSGQHIGDFTSITPIGVCELGDSPYGTEMYQIVFFSHSAGPYSVIPQTSWATGLWKGDDACKKEPSPPDAVEIENPTFCIPLGNNRSARASACEAYTYTSLEYNTADCSGPSETKITKINDTLDCFSDISGFPGYVEVAECLAPKGKCSGDVDIVNSANKAGFAYKINNVSYEIFDIVVRNTGSCPIVSVRLPYTIHTNITHSWNLFLGSDIVVTQHSAIYPGQVYQAAGMILDDSHSPMLEPKSGAPAVICSC